MLRPIHQMLLLTELLSWSLTLLVFASQQPKLPEAEQGEHYLVWINGSHSATDIRNGTIASPGFPSMHLSQTVATHNFHLSHRSPRGRIKLDFSDFFLTPLDNFVDCGSPYGDFVKVVDGGSTTVHCGQSRPQPYVSSTHQLVVEYHHASSSNMVTWAPSLFRASYQFLSHAAAVSIREDMAKGYYVQETEFNDAGSGQLYTSLPLLHHTRHVDYLWYVQGQMGRRIHFRVLDLHMSVNTSLDFRDGPSSASTLLLRIRGNFSQPSKRGITTSQPLAYVRWVGVSDQRDKLHVVFTEASFKDSHGHCPFGSFRCDSKLCIPSQRLCDGLPHCPDGEDESDKQCPESSRKMRRVMSRRQSTEPIDLSDCHCENGGTCLKDENVSSHDDQTLSSRVATKCLCTEEFSGDRCELMGVAKRHHLAAVIARCTCKNGGTCTPTSSGFGFVCSCAPGFRGYDCSHNDSIPNASSPTEYGIAMGAAVVAVLLVMFGVALCICVILQYLRQQREGPESPYSRTLSRDVYSVEGVDIAGLQMESVEPNDYIPPSYNQCMHPSPSSPEGDVFLTPSQSSQFSIGSRWRVRTPESPPPTYDAILGFCKECSELALRNMALKQQRTPSSDRFDTMSGASSYNYTTGPGSNYTTGSNTPVGQLPVSPRGMYGSGVAGGGVGISVGVGVGTPSGVAGAGGALVIRGTSTQSQTDSPLEEFELRRVQST